MKNEILYAQVTGLAYRINKSYYNNIHYVWCCDRPSYGIEQPISSNPIERSSLLIKSILSSDSHSDMIKDNRDKIKLGASEKRKQGVISELQEREIIKYVNEARLEEFYPILYIIPYNRVKDQLKEVAEGDKASKESTEYLITDLSGVCFDIVKLKNVLPLSIIED